MPPPRRQAAWPACRPGCFSVRDFQDRLDAGKHRFQFDAKRVAEFAHRDIDGDGEDGFDNLRLGEMDMAPVPQILRYAVGVAGAADRSYGIQVAKLAGLPGPVIARVRDVLTRLEANDRARGKKAVIDDLPLFAASAAPEPQDTLDAALQALDDVDPDAISPRQALAALYRPAANSGRSSTCAR